MVLADAAGSCVNQNMVLAFDDLDITGDRFKVSMFNIRRDVVDSFLNRLAMLTYSSICFFGVGQTHL